MQPTPTGIIMLAHGWMSDVVVSSVYTRFVMCSMIPSASIQQTLLILTQIVVRRYFEVLRRFEGPSAEIRKRLVFAGFIIVTRLLL